MSTCPQCGTTYPPQMSICPVDGTVLSSHGRASDPIVGTVIAGKYRIDAVLGRGGMGAVYRATHVMLNKTVAVKTINRDLIESAEMVQRFQREARAATSLEHPNIVAVYDLGQADDGGLYIAMEFVKGVDLKDVIRASGPMPAARIVPLLAQVASALARAHRNHIVHRDLKPQNLVIATDANGQERVKLLDFGIAKTLEEGATQLTADGYSLGTPQYMAPEQAMGEQVDGRADIYALGVILYEMLVGDVPFNAASAPAVLVKHLNEAPEPPSHRRPDLRIPPALEAVALRCLEKDPANRFQTAEEFGAALERSVPAGAPGDAGVTSRGATVIVSGQALTAPVAAGPRSDLAPATPAPAIAAETGNPRSAPAQASAQPMPLPNPTQAPAAKPNVNAPDASAAPAPTTRPAPSGKGRFVAVLLAIAALFLVAIALGGYAAYRVWKSRTTITSERASSEPAPAPVSATVPANTPPVSPVAAGGHDADTAAAATAPPATPRVPADGSREANRAGGGAGAAQASDAAAHSTRQWNGLKRHPRSCGCLAFWPLQDGSFSAL